MPFYSTDSNVVEAFELNSSAQQIAFGETGSNAVAPGGTAGVTLTMQMNSTQIGLTTDPAAGSDALLLSSSSSRPRAMQCRRRSASREPVKRSRHTRSLPMHRTGYVLPGTAAGNGGIPPIVLASQSSSGTSKVVSGQLGMSVLFDASYDPIAGNFYVNDPENGQTYNGYALIYYSSDCAYPSQVNMNIGFFLTRT